MASIFSRISALFRFLINLCFGTIEHPSDHPISIYQSAMASTSTSTSANCNHLVFINHRGVDVKKTLASHLYHRLRFHGIRAFLDKDEMEQGDDITRQIESAIGSASIHVAIFSPGYADSAWCLKELVLMQESNSLIIPVFYDVEPAELRSTIRSTKGSYAQKLEKLESRYDLTTVDKWRKALASAADISGFELKAYNGDEGKLLQDVFEKVLERVKTTALALEVAKYPTGLGDKVNDFENTVLLHRGKPHILGMVGLGGVGKTTLAKEFFNRKNSDYSKSCFLSDVRDNAGKGSLISLQKKLLKSLNVSDKIIERVNSVNEGEGILREHLSSHKVLVVIDDVDHEHQVHALFPDQTVLASDSLIVITSRNKAVIKSSGVEESSIYNLTGLTAQHSLELFCLHAFKQPHPLPEFEYLVDKFLEACGGLPLSLKVFGSLLHGKDTGYWEDQSNKLRRILPEEIKQRLQISYDALDREEQLIFLDIACFFIGEDKDMAIRIWDGGLSGFLDLQSKCLVEVNSENKIKMHDHLRDMGRDIAKDSGLPRRIWRWTENTVEDLLQHSSVTAKSFNTNGKVNVRGIRMPTSVYNEDAMPTSVYNEDADDVIPMMVGLQLLDTEDVLLERILTKVKLPNLIWLRWNNCPLSSLPSSISMKNIRVLQVQGDRLETLWENESQAPLHLRELEVNAPLSNIPESIGKLKHLERIVLQLDRSNLTKLPEEFCLLQSLMTLEIKSCEKMKSLPERFGNLTNLRHIDMKGCSELGTLPRSFGNLTNLRHIDMSWCSELGTLPSSFGELINLQYVDLGYCSNLSMSSETLGNISTLKYVNLNGCWKIEVFPQQVAHQRSIEQLSFKGTNLNIKELPSTIGELSNLKVLQIGGPLLETLPPSLCDLYNLEEFEVYRCEQLKCLPPSLGDIRNLKILRINRCKELKCLPAPIFEQLTQLTELCILDCPLIGELPFIKEVKVERQTLSDLDSSIDNSILPRLQRLWIYGTGISEVSFAEGVCCNLRDLWIQECNNLVQVGTLPNTLKGLSFSGCSNLRKIDQIYGLVKLQRLNIYGCIELEDLTRIEALVSLRELNANRCEKFKSIGRIWQLANLRSLDVGGCFELEELVGLEHCMSLEMLDASGCKKLKSIRGLGQLVKLRRVNVSYCSELEELVGCDESMSLEELDVCRCPKLAWNAREKEYMRGRLGEKYFVF